MTRRKSVQHKPRRAQDRPAFGADLDRMQYGDTLEVLFHTWARRLIPYLDRDIQHVLRVLGALRLCGCHGYPGLAVTNSKAAAVARKMLGVKCGERTWQNGCKKLVSLGVISRTWWTQVNQVIQVGGRRVTVAGNCVVHLGDDRYCNKKIRVTLLTDLGHALFDGKSADLSMLFDVLIPKAQNRKKSEVGVDNAHIDPPLTTGEKNPIRLRSDIPLPLPPGRGRGDSSNNIGKDVSTLPRVVEGSPTCPSRSPSSSNSTVEHLPSTPEPAISSLETKPETKSGGEALSKASRSSSATPRTGFRGCSESRPKIPRGARNRKGWTFQKTRIMNLIHEALRSFPTKQADRILSRAKIDLEMTDATNWPTVINRKYWLSNAHRMTRKELLSHVRSTIIPAFNNARAPRVPNENRQCDVFRDPGRQRLESKTPVTELLPWLKGVQKRQCDGSDEK